MEAVAVTILILLGLAAAVANEFRLYRQVRSADDSLSVKEAQKKARPAHCEYGGTHLP